MLLKITINVVNLNKMMKRNICVNFKKNACVEN